MTEIKKKCCQDCKKGQPGQNKSCQAKLMLEKLKTLENATESTAKNV